ncbi:PREDICTED: pentatricopeptide repeat-containing protein At1g62260, mitochondrial-like [Camelina sativa]|uniref:Pentatricopeptide repeat-containing protein At1g62260, mitochondrial-like n=1 Tax=Camelina sativa TaxID=90675 RepID=A0ABM0SZ18_CAMSA|nr:PREDICTED: pentatricopeptide repeat-containing protein At1g62260, mitochondrial-like [Camelina sativa]
MIRSRSALLILRKVYRPSCDKCLCANSFSSTSASSSMGFRATNKELNQMIRSGYIAEAREIFEKLKARNTVTWNTMISGYVKRREMNKARKLFDEMPVRDVVSWNAMISGYVSCGGVRFLEEARKLFDEMPSRDSFSWNTMISGYAKNRKVSEAFLLFEKMPERNGVSWSAMITGFCHNGEVNRAVELFRRMPEKDSSSLCALVAGLIKNERLEEAACVLSQYGSIDSGKEDLVYAYNTLIVGYGQRGQVEAARRLFDQIPDDHHHHHHGGEFRDRFHRNVVSWNSMIKSYLKVGDVVSARLLFDQMKDRDTISWNTMIDGYVHVSRMEEAFDLFTEMSNPDTHSWNMMVSGYASVGNVELARHYFEKTPEKTTVSWNTIIAAYEKNKDYKEAVDVFIRMNIEGEKPDPHTLTSLLSVSTGLVNLRLGMQMHQIVLKTVIPDVPVHNALITMYSRCGELMESRRIFDDMKLKREVITWNAMIGGYAFHGNALEALNLFWLMKCNRIHPSHITFVSVLNACAHAGLVDEAKAQFVSMMSEYSIKPQMEHYSSLVNVISGQGQFVEAMDVIKSMPFEPDKTVWGGLLDACRIYNNVALAHVAAEAMSRLEPESSTPYVLLYNMYADMGLWDKASEVRMKMESKRIKKERGSSWV